MEQVQLLNLLKERQEDQRKSASIEEKMRRDVQRSLGIIGDEGDQDEKSGATNPESDERVMKLDTKKVEPISPQLKSPARSPSMLAQHMRRAQDASFANLQFSSQAKWEAQRELNYKKRLQSLRRREEDVQSLEESVEHRESLVKQMETDFMQELMAFTNKVEEHEKEKLAHHEAIKSALLDIREEAEALEEDEAYLENLEMQVGTVVDDLVLYLSSEKRYEEAVQEIDNAFHDCVPTVSSLTQTDIDFDDEKSKKQNEQALMPMQQDELLQFLSEQLNHQEEGPTWRIKLLALVSTHQEPKQEISLLRQENEKLQEQLLHYTSQPSPHKPEGDDEQLLVHTLTWEKMKQTGDELNALKEYVAQQEIKMSSLEKDLFSKQDDLEKLQEALDVKTASLKEKEALLEHASTSVNEHHVSLLANEADLSSREQQLKEDQSSLRIEQAKLRDEKVAWQQEQEISSQTLQREKAALDEQMMALKRRQQVCEIEQMTNHYLSITSPWKKPMVDNDALPSSIDFEQAKDELRQAFASDVEWMMQFNERYPEEASSLSSFWETLLERTSLYKLNSIKASASQKHTALQSAALRQQLEESKATIVSLQDNLATTQSRAKRHLATTMELQDRLASKDAALSKQFDKFAQLEKKWEGKPRVHPDYDRVVQELAMVKKQLATLESKMNPDALKASLAEKQQQLVDQQMALVQKMAALTKEKLNVSKREGRVHRHQEQLDADRRRLAAREAQFAKARSRLDAREASLASQLSYLDTKKSQHRDLATSLSRQSKTISDRQDQLVLLQSTLSSKEKQLVANADRLTLKKQSLLAQEDSLLAREAAIALAETTVQHVSMSIREELAEDVSTISFSSFDAFLSKQASILQASCNDVHDKMQRLSPMPSPIMSPILKLPLEEE